MLLFLVLLGRGVYLVTDQRSFLLHENKKRVQRHEIIPAQRGMIIDRSGKPLAVSKKTYEISFDPSITNWSADEKARICEALGISASALERKVADKSKRFKVLARKVSVKAKQALNHVSYLNYKSFDTRFYPLGEASATLLGVINSKQQGVVGIEQYYNELLSGVNGKAVFEVDAKNHVISPLEVKKATKNGREIQLTIDAALQSQVYDIVKRAVAKYDAVGGVVIVSEVGTGDILAMVNYPSFNPNEAISEHNVIRKNHAVQSRMEPGSTIKPVWISWLLNKQLITESLKVKTSPGKLKIDDGVVKDTQDNGTLGLDDILGKSSNVGMAKLVIDLPSNVVEKMMIDMKLSHHYALGLPGEVSGSMNQQIEHSPFAKAVSSFGYGIAVTPIELARAYAIIAADGIDHPPKILMTSPSKSQKVLTEPVAKLVRGMLANAARQGTGWRAQVDGVLVAGKTGTTHKLLNGAYDATEHRASFVGFAPADQPKYLVLVMLDDPKGKWHYGGTSAAPVFKQVIGEVHNFEVRTHGTMLMQDMEER